MDAIEFKRGRVPKHRPSTGYVALFFDASVGAFRYVNSAGTITAIGGGSSGLTDAPSDGSTYGRLNGAWAVVSGSGGLTHPQVSARIAFGGF